MRRILAITAVAALLAGPALAQQGTSAASSASSGVSSGASTSTTNNGFAVGVSGAMNASGSDAYARTRGGANRSDTVTNSGSAGLNGGIAFSARDGRNRGPNNNGASANTSSSQTGSAAATASARRR